MNSLRFISTLSLFFILLLSGGNLNAQKKKQNKTQSLSYEQKVKHDRLYVDANKSKILGDFDEAISLFKQCLDMDPSNSGAAFEIGRLLYERESYGEAESFAKIAFEKEPKNKWYSVFYAETLIAAGNNEEAGKVYEKMLDSYPEEYEYYYEYAYLLNKTGKFKEAVVLFNRLETKLGVSEEVSNQKKRLFVKMNQFDKAETEMLNLLKTNEKEPRYYAYLAELYEVIGEQDKALGVYEDLLKLDPENPNAYLALAAHHRSQDQFEDAFKYMKLAYENPELDIDMKVQMLMPYMEFLNLNEDRKKEAIELSRLMVEAHNQDAKAHSLQGDILFQVEDLKPALAAFENAKKLDQGKLIIWERILAINSRLKQKDEMLKNSKEAIDLFPNQPTVYLFNGIAWGLNNDYDKANKVLEKGLLMVSENGPLEAEFYAQIAEHFHQTKNYQESDKNFESAIDSNPTNPYTMNNYSYYLSLRGDKLDKALSLSERSNLLDPGNPSFQDTFAWINYKLGNYDEAKKWLQQSLKVGGAERPVILEHLGDVLFKLDQKEEALKYWQLSKDKGGESPSLIKKITSKELAD